MQVNTLSKIGLKAVELIQDNIDSKQDAVTGKKFRFYSFGYWLKKKYKKKSRAKRGSKAKKKFMDTARSAYESGKQDVDLTQTGNMRSALTVISTDKSKNSFKIGFSNAESSQLAFWHNISGAGKGRVRRRFFMLSDPQKEKLAVYAKDLLIGDVEFANEISKMFKS